jgi:hypothetical protein
MNEMRANPMNASECPNQLEWSAFMYAAGELPAAEAEQFEARLADDQAAREALARAVALTQTVVAAESQAESFVVPAQRQAASWGTRLAWMAIGGLASIVIALVWSGALQNSASGPSDKQIALATAWTQARAGIAQAKEDGLWLPATWTPSESWSLSDADEELLAVNDASVDSLPGETPSWLTAAVFLAGEDSTIPEPFSGERREN